MDLRFDSELVVGLADMFEVTSIATVGQLNRMLFGIVMMGDQFNRLLQVAIVAARKELSLLFALRVPVF